MKEELTKKRKPTTTGEAVENLEMKIWPREGIHGGVRPSSVKSAVARTAAEEPMAGGDGGVTAFHDNGGRILESCRVILVFWGTAWCNPGYQPVIHRFYQCPHRYRYGCVGYSTGPVQGCWTYLYGKHHSRHYFRSAHEFYQHGYSKHAKKPDRPGQPAQP